MLHTLSPARGSRKRRIRAGRGISAGRGKTAGRGTKGQQARAGKGRRFAFEGGQTPLLRRQPKLGGFRNPTRVRYAVINVGTLEEKLAAGSYDPQTLAEAGIVSGRRPVKILSRGEVKKKFALTVHAVSGKAKEAIEGAGGTVTLIK